MLGLSLNKKSADTSVLYDAVIIGGSAAGLSAALYSGRARLKTLVIEELISGGQFATTETLENYPGFENGIGGMELAGKMEEQAKKFGAEIMFDSVLSADLSSEIKVVRTKNSEIKTKTVIIASGASPRRLKVEGAEKFHAKGVSYCATCDGPLFTDKRVVIIGGGNSAVEEGIFMTRFASKITFVQDLPSLTAEKILQERLYEMKEIDVLTGRLVKKINGTDKVASVTVEKRSDGSVTEIECDGVFVYIGYEPKTSFLGGAVSLNDGGYIKTDENMSTNIKGVYAAGDVREKPLRQVVTAVSDGAIAAFSAIKYIENSKEVL